MLCVVFGVWSVAFLGIAMHWNITFSCLQVVTITFDITAALIACIRPIPPGGMGDEQVMAGEPGLFGSSSRQG